VIDDMQLIEAAQRAERIKAVMPQLPFKRCGHFGNDHCMPGIRTYVRPHVDGRNRNRNRMISQASQPIANTINDAARRLGVGRTTVYELIGAHLLRTFKVGTRTLIPESELARFVQERMGLAS
jgi:excisionase family DNA binding protein